MALCLRLFFVHRHFRDVTTLNSNVYSHLASCLSQTDDAMFYCDAIKNACMQTPW